MNRVNKFLGDERLIYLSNKMFKSYHNQIFNEDISFLKYFVNSKQYYNLWELDDKSLDLILTKFYNIISKDLSLKKIKLVDKLYNMIIFVQGEKKKINNNDKKKEFIKLNYLRYILKLIKLNPNLYKNKNSNSFIKEFKKITLNVLKKNLKLKDFEYPENNSYNSLKKQNISFNYLENIKKKKNKRRKI